MKSLKSKPWQGSWTFFRTGRMAREGLCRFGVERACVTKPFFLCSHSWGPTPLPDPACPSDPLSGEMRRLCHNSAAPTSYHPFHKHLRCSQSFIIHRCLERTKQSNKGWSIKMRAWVGQGRVQLPHPRCELGPGPAAPRATPLCRDRGCLGWAWPSLSLGLDLLPIILLCTMQSNAM